MGEKQTPELCGAGCPCGGSGAASVFVPRPMAGRGIHHKESQQAPLYVNAVQAKNRSFDKNKITSVAH